MSWGAGHICRGIFWGHVLMARRDAGRETNSCAVSSVSRSSAGASLSTGPLKTHLQRFYHEGPRSISSLEGCGCSSRDGAPGSLVPRGPRVSLPAWLGLRGVRVSLALTGPSPPGTREPHRSRHPAWAASVSNPADPSEAVWDHVPSWTSSTMIRPE